MHLLYKANQVRELDRIAIEELGVSGLTLMKRAAEACIEALMERWPVLGSIAVLCGSGNNAGDGFIIAGLLREKGFDVRICLVGSEPVSGSDAERALDYARASHLNFVSLNDAI